MNLHELKHGMRLALVFFALLSVPKTLYPDESRFTRQEKAVITMASCAAAITAWGILNWDYFSSSPKRKSEGWFSDTTGSGGADKLGHFFSSYALSHLLTDLYEDYGYSRERGAFLGSLSSLGLETFIELGDSFSDYGFSHEDLVMNLLGSTAGYILAVHPDLSRKIDFRIEYRPHFDRLDIVTDYEHQKFLMALKLDGFRGFNRSLLKHFELHLGYFTRGYDNRIDRERNIYIGVGLNISRFFKSRSMPKIAKAFSYVQLPYTYLDLEHDVNP